MAGAALGLGATALAGAALESGLPAQDVLDLACAAGAGVLVTAPSPGRAARFALPIGLAAAPTAIVLGAPRLEGWARWAGDAADVLALALSAAVGAGLARIPGLFPQAGPAGWIAAAAAAASGPWLLLGLHPVLVGIAGGAIALAAPYRDRAHPLRPPFPATPPDAPVAASARLAAFGAGVLAAVAGSAAWSAAAGALVPLPSLGFQWLAAAFLGVALGAALRRPSLAGSLGVTALGILWCGCLLPALPAVCLARPEWFGGGAAVRGLLRLALVGFAVVPAAAGVAALARCGALARAAGALGLVAGIGATSLSASVPPGPLLRGLAVLAALASVVAAASRRAPAVGSGGSRAPRLAVALGAAAVFAVAAALPEAALLPVVASPAAATAPDAARLRRDLSKTRVAAAAWGRSGPAAATRGGVFGERLWHEGHTVPAGAEDAARAAFLAHLPFLFKQGGSGVRFLGLPHPAALAAVFAEGASRVEVVAPPAVLAAALRSPAWAGALQDPRVRAVAADAWSPPSGTGGPDVLISRMPPTWSPSGVAAWDPRRLSALAGTLGPGGAMALGVPSVDVEPAVLARAAGALAAAGNGGLVWVGPGGDEVVLLVLPGAAAPIDATAAVHALSRSAVARDLRGAGILEPADLLSRAMVALGDLAPPSTGRRGVGMGLRAEARLLGGARAAAVDALPAALPRVGSLFGLERLAPEVRQRLDARLSAEDRVRDTWLELVKQVARGDSKEALRLSAKLADQGGGGGAALAPLTGSLVGRARALLAGGQAREAETQLVLATAIDPGNAEALSLLGRIALHGGDARLAGERFDQVLESAPDDLVALVGRAEALRREGRLDDAATTLEHAVAAHPASVEARNNLANVYREKGLLELAAEAYRRAQPLAPRDPRIMAGLAETYYYMARERPRDGRPDPEALARALEQVQLALAQGEGPGYRSLLGQILLALGRIEQAKAELMKAVLREPEDVAAIGNLGIVFEAEGRPDQARGQWERVLEIAPDNAAARENLARLRAREPAAFRPGR